MASVSEAYIGYYLYRSFKATIEEKFEYHSRGVLIAIVALCAPIFSSLIGVTSLLELELIAEDVYFSNWITWYYGDVLAILIFLPIFVSFKEIKHKKFDYFAPFMTLFFMSLFNFYDLSPYVFLIFSLILIPAILGSILGVYYSLAVIGLVLNWFQITNTGPFSHGNFQENMAGMQFFLLSLAVTALSIEGFKRTKLIKSAIAPLLIFWTVTGAIYSYFYFQKNSINQRIIKNTIQEFQSRLTEKMHFHENAIRGASGFVASSKFVSIAEWNDFASSISLVDEAYGIRALILISSDKKYNYTYPDKMKSYFSIEKHLKNPEIMQVFDESSYAKKALLTPAIKTIVNDKEIIISLLVSAVKKQNKLIAWIVTPIDMVQFINSITLSRNAFLDIDIFEGRVKDENKKIFSKVVDQRVRDESLAVERLSTMLLADRAFTIDWNETHRYLTNNTAQNSFIIFLSAFFSIIGTGFILNLKLININATKMAGKRSVELKESEEKFKSLFDNSSDAVILFNNHTLLDCNPQSLELFGKKTKKELITTPIDDLFLLRNLDFLVDKDLFKSKKEEVQKKRVVHFECLCQKDGVPFFAEMHLHYLQVNEDFIYQAVVRDISERKKIEQNLTHLKELAEETARAKSNFLSTMSHEMRTPLNGVIGMVNIILEENPASEIREDLETIKYSADNLLHIVNEVLDYNKIESGKIVIEKKSFDLKYLCESVLKIHKPKAQEKNLQLTLSFDNNIPDNIMGDEYRNGQILNNLLSNALKFTKSGDVKLNIALKSLQESYCIVEFSVIDTGIGIEQNKLRSIFNEFTQAENDHTRKYGGTGLGLAITKRLVEIQNGKISVTSATGVGTTFVYTINFDRKNRLLAGEEDKIKNISSVKFSDRHKILLVEDNEINILVTKKFLEKWGLEVDVALNGREAVSAVESKNYDLILMDLHMPLMDGFEATKKIREFNTLTPIIGLSADVMTESISSLQDIGMDDFVSKPFKPSDFYDKLYSFLI